MSEQIKAGSTVVLRREHERDEVTAWGVVNRVARDRSWADVKWSLGWSKRHPQPDKYLVAVDA